MNKTAKIYVAGHNGMVGSALVRKLNAQGYGSIITKNSGDLDLRDQTAAGGFFEAERPEYVFLPAARDGGIYANNTYRAELIYENLMIPHNVIHSAYKGGVKTFLFRGSSCIFPRLAAQPLSEDCGAANLNRPMNLMQ